MLQWREGMAADRGSINMVMVRRKNALAMMTGEVRPDMRPMDGMMSAARKKKFLKSGF
jgi:hypothetical protein